MDNLRTHCARLLELDDSWEVEDVALAVEERRVEIRLKSVGNRVSCPECGQACRIADHSEERHWRHLDTMQFITELVVAWFGNPDPVDMKVYCPCGEEAFDDEETTEEAQAGGDRREAA